MWGDVIEFIHTENSSKTLLVKAVDLFVFDSFVALYENLPLSECGYTEKDIDTAAPDDMDAYYSKVEQEKYGVVEIKVALLYVSTGKVKVNRILCNAPLYMCSVRRRICFAA